MYFVVVKAAQNSFELLRLHQQIHNWFCFVGIRQCCIIIYLHHFSKESAEKVKIAHGNTEDLLNGIEEKKKRNAMIAEKLDDVRKRLNFLTNNVTEYKSYLENVDEKSRKILQVCFFCFLKR